MEWQIVAALLLASPFVLFPAAFVWYMNVGGIMKMHRRAGEKGRAFSPHSCSIDADCPPGHVCVSGRCVPQS